MLKDSVGAPELILIATGSEVGLAMDAARQLGDKVRVVSMPSTTVFDRQDPAYRESVLPKACRKRVAIEAGVTDCWRKYVGLDGAVIGIDEFGASAPAEQLFPYFGFTLEKVVEAARRLVGETHALDAARTLTAWMHGFTSMELAGAFRLGGEVDAAWEFGLDRVVAGLADAGAEGAGE